MSFNFPTSAYLNGAVNWTLPNSDWCFACLVRVDDNSGGQNNCFLSSGTTQPTLEFGLYLLEAGRAASPGCVVLRVSDGTNPLVVGTSTVTMPLGQWVLLVAQRSGSEKQLWQGAMGTVPVKQVAPSGTLGACTFNAPLMIARRCIAPTADTNLLGWMAYVAYGAFALTVDEMTALAAGACPVELKQWGMYLPFLSAGPSALTAPVGGNVFNVTGSPATDGQPMRLW